MIDAVQIVQAVPQAAQGILVEAHRLLGLGGAEEDALGLDAAHHLVGGAGGAAEEDGAGGAAAGLEGAQARLGALDRGGLGALAVHVALQHRVPALGQGVDGDVADVAVVERQAAGQDQQVVVAVLPQAVDDLGHQLEHAAGALEVVQAGPVLVEAVEDLGVDGIGAQQALAVVAVLGFGGEVGAVGGVVVGEGAAHRFRRLGLGDGAEQAPAHDLEGLLGGHRLPQGLDAAEVVGQAGQGLDPALAAGLAFRLGQGGEHDGGGHRLEGLGEGLDEGQVGIEGAAAQGLALLELAHVGHQLVHQDDAGGIGAEQGLQGRLTRRGAGGVGVRHQGVAGGAAQLPGQVAPEGVEGLAVAHQGLVGGGLVAVEDHHPRPGQAGDPGGVQQGGDPGEVAGGDGGAGEVIDRHLGVGLAAAEGGLELDDRIAAAAGEAVEHRVEQQAHALGDVGALEEQHRVLVLRRGLAGMDPGQVGRELGLLEGAFEDVLVGYGDLAPGFECHAGSSRLQFQMGLRVVLVVLFGSSGTRLRRA